MKVLLVIIIFFFSFFLTQIVGAENSIFDVIAEEKDKQTKNFQVTSGEFYESAELTLIDKNTGKFKSISVAINRPVTLKEKLVIRLLACWQEDRKRINPDAKALIELYKVQSTAKLEKEFFGWFFSRKPILKDYNNPVFDITLKRCF